MEYIIMDANLLNGLSLAYIGDAVFEIKIREYALSLGYSNVNKLHKFVCSYTSGKAQSDIIRYYLANGILSEKEEEIYKRGRNVRTGKVPKNSSPGIYHRATGLEALFGYLYLTNNMERAYEFIKIMNI